MPWDRGADLQPGEAWDAERFPMDERVRRALVVNLLTEDNLPYYFHTIDRLFGQHEAWAEWARRWTAEEGRHSIVIRDYLTVTRAVDPVALERGRMQQVSTGFSHPIDGAAEGLVYVSIQELATRISHRNTGVLIDEPAGYEVMARVAADENLHHLFYRDACAAAFELDPSRMVVAADRQVRGFAMPGTGIDDFAEHAKEIAKAGVYDLAIHHDQILVPLLHRHWRITELQGLDDEAQQARDRLLKWLDRLGKVARRLAVRREDRQPAGASS